jgi:hypothetical protein
MPGTYAVAQLPADAAFPEWATGEFTSVVRTASELTVVCDSTGVPAGTRVASDWRCLHVEAIMDFSTIGVLAGLCGCLADAGVSVFACSTFDTDYLLVRSSDLQQATLALERGGHTIVLSR